MDAQEYWEECIAITADEAEIGLTLEQIKTLAEGVKGGHENYGMAFYSPPASDRYNQIEREWKEKYEKLEREFERYRNGAETAIKRALPQRVYRDEPVSITPDGDVFKHGGRTTQIL